MTRRRRGADEGGEEVVKARIRSVLRLIEFSMMAVYRSFVNRRVQGVTRGATGTHNLAMLTTSLNRAAGRGMAALLAVLLPTPAAAWNFAGHRLAACIAWEQLTPPAREQVAMLLRAHPDHARWTRYAKGDAPDRAAFIEASTWADRIRHDPRFHDADEPATPLLPGFPDMRRHDDWHYVNRALASHPGASDRAAENVGQLDRQLERLAATLDPHGRATPAERSYALPWVIHLVADAHQPLHVADAAAAWIAPADDSKQSSPSSLRRRNRHLHAFWDDLPGPSNLAGKALDSTCGALLALHPPPAASTPRQWIDESQRIAETDAIPTGYEQSPHIGKAFYANAREIADRRIVAAGYRLAELLNRQRE